MKKNKIAIAGFMGHGAPIVSGLSSISIGKPIEGKVNTLPPDAKPNLISWDQSPKTWKIEGKLELGPMNCKERTFLKNLSKGFKPFTVLIRNKAFARPVRYVINIPTNFTRDQKESLAKYIKFLYEHRTPIKFKFAYDGYDK